MELQGRQKIASACIFFFFFFGVERRNEAKRSAGKAREEQRQFVFEHPVVAGDGHVSVRRAEIRSGSLRNAGTQL